MVIELLTVVCSQFLRDILQKCAKTVIDIIYIYIYIYIYIET
jgi:hypothetical protein